MTQFIALGRVAEGTVGYLVDNGVIVASGGGASEADVLRKLNGAAVPRVGIDEGEPSEVPCAVLTDQIFSVPLLTQSFPADVISGWVRLRVAGFLADHDNWDGVAVVLHDDVVHWLHLSADEIVSAATSLTPRFYAAFKLGEALPDDDAIADTLSRPERLMTYLRSDEIRGDASSCLGHLIGSDLAATRAYWLGQRAAVIGDGSLAAGYAEALKAQGVPVDGMSSETALEHGLAVLGEMLLSQPGQAH